MKNVFFIGLMVLLGLAIFPILGNSTAYAICVVGPGAYGPHVYNPGDPTKPNTTSQIISSNCNGLATGNYSKSLECIGTTGYRYRVTYCTGSETIPMAPPNGKPMSFDAGCLETYNEEGVGTAPTACNSPDQGTPTDVQKAFGQITPPLPIQGFGYGAAGISKFLSSLVVLLYSLAAIVVLFMFIWAAFDWITSGGEKEKLAGAQKRILNAGIGLVLLAASFAILRVLTTFTGFSFFKG